VADDELFVFDLLVRQLPLQSSRPTKNRTEPRVERANADRPDSDTNKRGRGSEEKPDCFVGTPVAVVNYRPDRFELESNG